MKKIILLCFMFLSLGVYADEEQTAKNFAHALLGSNKTKIALITSKIPRSDKDLSPEHLSFISNPKCKKFKSPYTSIRTDIYIIDSFCEKLKTNIFLKRDKLPFFTRVDKIQPVFIVENSIWLLLLSSMYDESGKIKQEETEGLKGIEEFGFINRDNFYRIPIPEIQNAVCLKWINRKDFPSSSLYVCSEMSLVEDIKILSNIFCGNNISPLSAIEKVNSVIPKLKTGLGVKIAKQIVSISEDKIIKEEFKLKGTPKLDFQKIENRLKNAK